MTNIGSDSNFRDSFLEGAARVIFVMAYASYVEEGDSGDNDLTEEEQEERSSLPRPGAGEDWCDYAPETPPNAYALAGQLWEALERENKSVYILAKRAGVADGECIACGGIGHDDKYVDCESCGGRGYTGEDLNAEKFGSDLAMQWMGTGVSWFDDHKKFPLVVPHTEISGSTFSPDVYKPRSGSRRHRR